MALFLAALLHTFFVGVVALYSRQTDRRWDIFEDDEMRRYVGRSFTHPSMCRADCFLERRFSRKS